MLIAVVSAVPRLPRLLPKALGNDVVLYTPILLMIVAIIYWLARVFLTRGLSSRAPRSMTGLAGAHARQNTLSAQIAAQSR